MGAELQARRDGHRTVGDSRRMEGELPFPLALLDNMELIPEDKIFVPN